MKRYLALLFCYLLFSPAVCTGENLVTNGDFATAVDKAAAKVVLEVTKANPGVVTFAAAHGFIDGDVIYFASLDGMTELNTEYWKLRAKAGDTFELTTVWDTTSLNTSGYGAKEDSGNGRGQKCTIPDWSAQVPGWQQSTDGAGALLESIEFSGGASTKGILQNILTIGLPYRTKYTISNYASGSVRSYAGVFGVSHTADGTYYDYFVATSADFGIYGLGSFIGTADDVEVRETRGGKSHRRLILER